MPNKKQKKLQEKIEKAAKPVSENQVGRVAQGKIISDVAKAEGVEFSPALEQGLKNGSKKAVETAQTKLQDAGVFNNETTQSNLNPVSQQQQNFTPQENKTIPKAQFADSPELNPYKEKISELTNEFNDIQRQLTDAYGENSKAMNNGDTQTMQQVMTRINNLNQQSLNKQTEIQTAQEELRKAREKVFAQTQNSNAQFDAVQNQTKEILKQIQDTPSKTEVTPAEEPSQKKVYKINQGENSAENVKTPKQVEEIPEDNSAQNSVELPEGYRTESGRSLDEADSQEFILKPDGSKDFGKIDNEIVAVANEKMQKDNSDFRFKTAPVRLQVGEEDKINENGEKVEGFGYKHILEHIDQIKAKGFENIPSYIEHILKNFNEVRKSSEIENRIVLYCKGDESKGLMPLDLELEKGNDDFYTIVTAYPRRRANKKDTLLSDARPTNAPTDTASVPRLEDSNDKSGVTTSRDIAEENNVSAENIPQVEQSSNNDFSIGKFIDGSGEEYFGAFITGKLFFENVDNEELKRLAAKHNGIPASTRPRTTDGKKIETKGGFRFASEVDRDAFINDPDVEKILDRESMKQYKEYRKQKQSETEEKNKGEEYAKLCEKSFNGEELTAEEKKKIVSDRNLLLVDENLREKLYKKFPEVKHFIDRLFTGVVEKDKSYEGDDPLETLAKLIAINKEQAQPKIYAYAADRLRDFWHSEHFGKRHISQAARDKSDKVSEIFKQYNDKKITEKELYNRVLKTLHNRSEKSHKGIKSAHYETPQGKVEENKNSVVEVTGNEFGEYSDIKELRKKAIQYYREHLQGTSVENKTLGRIDLDENGIVEFTKSGRDEVKSTSAKEHKLLLVKYLPQLIKNSTNISEESPQKEKHKQDYFYYLHTFATINGVRTPVDITLVKRNDKTIQFYNHTLPTEEVKKDTLVSAEPVSSNEALGTLPVNVSSAENIPQSENDGKRKTVDNTKKFSRSEENIGNGLLEILYAPAGTKFKAGYSTVGGKIEYELYSVEEIDGRKFLKADDGDSRILNRTNLKEYIASNELENLEVTFPANWKNSTENYTSENPNQEGLKFSGKGNLDLEIKNPSVANVALQLGGEIKDGHLTFKNPKDEETFRKHLENLDNPDFKLSIAWHGTPHAFDSFSLQAIGTGEGAQVHGYGLYTAEARKVGEGYKERLGTVVDYNGKTVEEFLTDDEYGQPVFFWGYDENSAVPRVC